MRVTQEILDYMRELERAEELDPSCKTCVEHFYPAVRAGRNMYEVFAPRHKASPNCESGKHAHCSCDACF